MKRQQGLTLISWVVVLTIVISLVMVGIRLVPGYIQAMSIKTSIKSLAQEPGIEKMSPNMLRQKLQRKFEVNDVQDVDPKTLKVKKQSNGSRLLSMEYEIRVHAIGNIDAVLVFDQEVEVQ